MNINEIVLSIVKRPSFNLLAFQAFTFAVMTIAGAIGAFQFAPFFGWAKVYWYYIYELFLIAVITSAYTIFLFIIANTLNKAYIIFNKKLIIANTIIFYILFGILTLLLELQNSSETINLAVGIFGYFLILTLEIFICTIIPYVVMFVIEQMNNIRLELPPYCRTPLRFWAVIIPAFVYISIIICFLCIKICS